MPKRLKSLRQQYDSTAHFRLIAPGDITCSFKRNAAAMAIHWQLCVQQNRSEIWTSDLSLQKQWPTDLLRNVIMIGKLSKH